MQINTEKWGQESEWQVDTNLSTSTWQDTNLFFYNGKYRALSDYRTAEVFDYNTPIDYSIAYSAHAADTQMPLADMAIYNHNAVIKYTQQQNNGWWLAEQNSQSAGEWGYYNLLSSLATGSPSNLYTLGGAYRWSPDAANSASYYPYPTNLNRLIRPIVKFSPKSFFGVIYCQLIKNDETEIVSVYLKTLKDNINTYKDNYKIAKVYMRLYSYNGRVSQNGNYNNFTTKSLNACGAATTQPIPVGDKEFVSYYQTIGTTTYGLPIAGTIYFNSQFGTYCGVRTDYQRQDSGGGHEWMQGVVMNHLVESVSHRYFYSNVYGDTYLICVKIPITTEVIDELYKGAAAYGIFFSDALNGLDVDTTNVARWLNENMYCGVLDENGVGHGEFTKGFGNAANPIFLWDSNQDSPYDPSRPPSPVDPNTYSNTTGFNSLTSGATATLKYVLDSGNVRNLLTDLWTISHNIAGADYENFDYKILDSFLVSNPIDSIVSLKRFPFDIPHTFSTEKTNVCLGKNTGSSQGYITHNVFNTVVFSGKRIYAKFGGSFLDYAPYTEYELYIPFCGTVKLNAGDILDHVLNCRLQIDLTTGTCTAYIMADDLVIETATGVVSCELQVAGTDSATVDGNIQNAVLDHIGARTNKEISMLSPLSVGGLMSAVSNPWKASGNMTNAQTEVDRAEYALTHIQTPVHSMGNAGGLTGWYQEFNARIIIYYPEGEAIDSSAPVSSTSPHLADLSAYAHNVGFSCCMNGLVSDFHGKTVGNIDTSSIAGATEEERAQIKSLFARGVWLP